MRVATEEFFFVMSSQVKSSCGLAVVKLVLVLTFWSCFHHCPPPSPLLNVHVYLTMNSGGGFSQVGSI